MQLHYILAGLKNAEQNIAVSDQDDNHEETLTRLRIMLSELDRAKHIANKMIEQIAEKKSPGVEIKIKLYDLGGIDCLEKDCPFKQDCANHETAGDFRNEDGFTPDLYVVDGNFFCRSKKAGKSSETNCGALVFENNELVKFYARTNK
jgi:hypothetical protein